MERIGKALHKSWINYCQGAGVLLMAALLSYGVLSYFSVDGPVVQVTDGPHVLTKEVPYRGELSYKLSTRRNASCPGTSMITFQSLDSPPVSVIMSRPIVLPTIGKHDNVRVNVELPRSVFPGTWMFSLSVDSQCPTYERQDMIVRFPIEVKDVD